MHTSSLIMLAINSVKKFLEIDYMEYATDATAQEVYVSSSNNFPKTEYAVGSNTLLTHFNGVDGATTYTAETGQTVTFVGTAQLDTAQKKFGTASLLLDGDSDYCTIPDSVGWDFGTGDFTIDAWFRYAVDPSGSVKRVISRGDVETNNGDWCLGVAAARINFAFRSGGSITDINYTVALVKDTWYHLALVRSGTTVTAYLDGISKGTGTCSATLDSNTVIFIGCRESVGTYAELFNGWIDEVRILKGTAVWTSNFNDSLVSYSEPTIKQQGSYSLKGIASITDALNDTLIRTLGTSTLDLSGKNLIKFGMYASRTGSNIKLGFSNIAYTAVSTGTITCGTVEVTGLWTSCTTAVLNVSDNSRAEYKGSSYNSFQLSDFSFGIPTNAVITGVAVRVEFRSTNVAISAYVKCALSWDDGTTWTADSAEQSMTGSSDATKTFGSSSDTWGRAWAVSDFANGSFRLKVYGHATSVFSIEVDYVDVRVYYQTPSSSVTMEYTPTVSTTNVWETMSWDISAISAGDRDYIDQIILTIVNADAANTFYIDNMRAR